ncbi:hypothetical protein FF38_11480 [Lucilia cuprina]|uniref:C2H2-type domain-containing protein n=1 Tax=Lucilia cuprina TaxID=7375 RepID=A0A0L0CR63_LUCCU|nr:hypothetical protein FF38_11480 [Lucilia cuprina]
MFDVLTGPGRRKLSNPLIAWIIELPMVDSIALHSMKMHHLTHHVSEERPLFKCSHMNCEYSTVSKSFLTTHMKSHSMESIKCTEKNCNYVGKTKIQNHIKTRSVLK